MAATHRALPTLLRICAAFDPLFIVERVPFGAQLAGASQCERPAA